MPGNLSERRPMKIYYWVRVSVPFVLWQMKRFYLFLSDYPIMGKSTSLLIGGAAVMSMLWSTRKSAVCRRRRMMKHRQKRTLHLRQVFLGVCILTPGAAAAAQSSESWPFWQRACSFSVSCDITLPPAKCSQTPERIICFQKWQVKKKHPPKSTTECRLSRHCKMLESTDLQNVCRKTLIGSTVKSCSARPPVRQHVLPSCSPADMPEGTSRVSNQAMIQPTAGEGRHERS